METTSTQVVVTVDLDATKQSEAVVGEPVTVELPDGSTVDGKITAGQPGRAELVRAPDPVSGSGGGSAGARRQRSGTRPP